MAPKPRWSSQTATTTAAAGTPGKRVIGAEVVDNDSVKIRDLPPALQDIILKMQVGEATPPFGSAEDGVRALVLCGRDDPQSANEPTPDQKIAIDEVKGDM